VCLVSSCPGVGLEGMYGIVYVTACILNLGNRWSECSFSPSGSFTFDERASVAHWTGWWLGPTSGLGVLDKRKSLASVGSRTAAPRLTNLVSVDYSDCAVFMYGIVTDWFVSWWNRRRVVTDTGKWWLNLCSRAGLLNQ
jgi:hypothetical protein